jgi:hypothetical protein
MKFNSRRGLVALATVAASVAVSGIGAGGAQAALLSPCAGSNIEGQGSSLQGAAQDIWTSVVGSVGFNNNMNGGCTTSPTVRYTRTSSGQCLNKWHADGTTAWDTTVAYCGTDDAPTAAQIANINASTASGGSGSSVLSIPVAQAAIAILVNPPAGCSITTATAATLEQAFRGAVTTWAGLGGTGCGAATITRVRRNDSSGTTYQLKHWLTTQTGTAVHAGTTWGGLQGANTTWPGTTTASQSGCSMAFPCGGGANSGSGGGDEVKTVGVTSGSLGYAALSDARSVTATGTYPTLKWIQVRQGSTTTDPSSNGLSSTKARSNCPTANNAYGTLPASTTASWADVYETTPGFFYPLCTLTWDTALADYTPRYGAGGQAIATTVHDYLNYVLNTSGGQADALTSNNDYGALGTDVRTAATAGIAEITD